MSLRDEFCTEKVILKYDILISWAVSKKMRADVSYFGP